MTTITYLGTGLLGSAFIEAAATRGERLAVWNRTIEKARALAPFGVRVAESPEDAVRGARIVHLVLKDDAVVDEVIAAARPGLSPDAIIVDHTTTQPALTAARAARLNAEGVRYLHCPVFIGPAAARQTQGTILASGPRALFDAVHDDLARMAPRVEYFGERPDLAAVYKLCGNAFIIGIAGLVADVLSVAPSAGASPADALDVVGLFDPSAMIRGRGRNIVARQLRAELRAGDGAQGRAAHDRDGRRPSARRPPGARGAHGRADRGRPRRRRPRRDRGRRGGRVSAQPPDSQRNT